MSFENYLLGHLDKCMQAQSDPIMFSSVELIWELIDGGAFKKELL